MKKIKINYFVSLLMITIFMIIFYSLSSKAQAFKRLNKNDNVIPFTLKNINGQSVSIESYQGNSSLAIVFWKYPSPRSVEEMNILQDLYNKYKDKGFEIIAVYSPETTKGVSKDEMTKIYELIADNNYSFNILLDEDFSIYNKYGVLTFPSLALISKEGKVFEILPGFPRFSGERNLKNNVMSMLGIEIPKKEIKYTGYQPIRKAERNLGIAKRMYKTAFYSKAEIYTKNAIKIDTGYVDAYALLGNIYAKKGNVELAETNFKIALKLDSTNSETYFDYGMFCRDRDMAECAQAEFEKVLSLNPFSGNGHYGLGSMYRLQKKYDEAVSEFEEAIRIFEENNKSKEPNMNLAETYYELGLIAMYLKQDEKSLNNLKKANILYKDIVTVLIPY